MLCSLSTEVYTTGAQKQFPAQPVLAASALDNVARPFRHTEWLLPEWPCNSVHKLLTQSQSRQFLPVGHIWGAKLRCQLIHSPIIHDSSSSSSNSIHSSSNSIDSSNNTQNSSSNNSSDCRNSSSNSSNRTECEGWANSASATFWFQDSGARKGESKSGCI